MEDSHNGIRITSTARQLEDGKWVADAQFDVAENDHRNVSQFPSKTYDTRDDAERAAIEQAKRMIDRRAR